MPKQKTKQSLQISGKILASVFLLAFAVRLLSLHGALVTFIPSIAFSLAAGYIVYLAGKKIKNRKVGLYSSIFFLFNPLVVSYSQTIGPQMLVACIIALLLYAYFFFKNVFVRGVLIAIFLIGVISNSIVSKVPLFRKPMTGELLQNVLSLSIGKISFTPLPLFYTMAILWTGYTFYVALRKYEKQKLLTGLLLGGLALSIVSPQLNIVYLAVILSLLLGLGVETRVQRIRILIGSLFFIAVYLVR